MDCSAWPPGARSGAPELSRSEAYYYAEAADGATWSGPFGPYRYPNTAWSMCIGIGQIPAPPNLLSLREVYIASSSHTVNLVP